MSTEQKCGVECGLEITCGHCVICEMHGLCHMCVEENWARKFDINQSRLKEVKEALAKLMLSISHGERCDSVEWSGETCNCGYEERRKYVMKALGYNTGQEDE